jgi:hypothetical protein
MDRAAEYSAVELLRNGRSIQIRALRASDRTDLVSAVGRTSARSLYRRFFGLGPRRGLACVGRKLLPMLT